MIRLEKADERIERKIDLVVSGDSQFLIRSCKLVFVPHVIAEIPHADLAVNTVCFEEYVTYVCNVGATAFRRCDASQI